jgi:dTDP-L-rhamnose 4-epimerase
MTRVLITGGAGFIGSHVADELLERDYIARVLDVVDPGTAGEAPAYLAPEVEMIVGDITDPVTVRRALEGVDAVVHLAARVGVAQSMRDIEGYIRANDLGTAVLLEELRRHRVARLVVGSTMSVYGEGLYLGQDQRTRNSVRRLRTQMEHRMWDPFDQDGKALAPVLTPEWKQPDPTSLYAVTKYAQERMCLLYGEVYRIPTVALRIFSAYGPRQNLANPYSGVLASFASRLLAGEAPLVYEDGRQKRDFIHVRDVARAIRLALEKPGLGVETANVGSGRGYPVGELARRLADIMGKEIEPQVTGEFRVGDVRHCFADPSHARKLLGFEAEVDLDTGLAEFVTWLEEYGSRELVAHRADARAFGAGRA